MKERGLFWIGSVFLLSYIVFVALIGSIFFITQYYVMDSASFLAFICSALFTSYILVKKYTVKTEKINQISTVLAAITLLVPYALSLLLFLLGIRNGVFGYADYLTNQIWIALAVFAIMKYSLEGRLFWKKRQSF